MGPELLGNDLRHPQQRFDLEPLGCAHNRGARPDVRRRLAHHRPASVRRDGGHHQITGAERFVDRRRYRHRIGESDFRQVNGVGAARQHILDEDAVARPQPHVVSDASQMHGEGRSPAACSEYGNR